MTQTVFKVQRAAAVTAFGRSLFSTTSQVDLSANREKESQ
jgi:hypothetical protein